MKKASGKALSDANRILDLSLKHAEPWALVAICLSEIERQKVQIAELKSALLNLVATSSSPDAEQYPTVAAAYDRAANKARAIIVKTGGVS